ncbi:MAG: hypothetical protein A4E42_01760 [Methanoregulaceae archaeon PtaU1.Bin222]|nr:MAG: hypothetical protein A4E42_01760 [Methanoregulaceae archaeon PtaU1.Bin222]
MIIRKTSTMSACDTTRRNNAVSAVVGVMLMLVITLIIAAVVSTYAGGMVSTNKKPEQVTVTARTEGNNAILFDHMGGDSISLADTVIILDQGNRNVRISTRNNISGTLLFNKAGTSFVRSGDTVKLEGEPYGKSHTWFNTTDSGNISIESRREFTWTLLSRTSNSILARGTLEF